jgi:uncharacterized membrane protein YraQ (UPF0718 family)
MSLDSKSSSIKNLQRRSVGAVVGSISLAATLIAIVIFLPSLVSKLIHSVFAANPRAAEMTTFFVAEILKLAALLFLITWAATLTRALLPTEKIRATLSRRKELSGQLVAAGVGVATPFCSCSAVPVFTGFVSAGVPLALTMTFLVSSPMVNEVAIFLLASTFGVATAAVYALAGILIALVVGRFLGRTSLANIEASALPKPRLLSLVLTDISKPELVIDTSLVTRIRDSRQEATRLLRTTMPYVAIATVVGAIIHTWVPASSIEMIGGFGAITGVLLATLAGVPLYSSAATVLPLIDVLAGKGIPTGTLLAFMMSVTALSLPEAILLRRVMKPRLLAMYFGSVAMGIVVVGILMNSFLPNW